jgi:DGQHR domain-containing protein
MGILHVDMKNQFIINDGQHRHAGIARLIKEKNMLQEDSIGVWLIPDLHLEKSQQFFSDINRHAKPVSSSLNRLYDHRCLESTTTRTVLEEVPFLTKFVELEKASCSKNKLILLESLHKANNKYFPEPTPTKLVDFWNTIATNVPEWEYIWNISCNPSNDLPKEINTLKRDTIAFSTTFIFAIASLGNEINPDKLMDLELGKENSKLIEANILYENPATTELKVVRGGAGVEKMKDYLVGKVLLTI